MRSETVLLSCRVFAGLVDRPEGSVEAWDLRGVAGENRSAVHLANAIKHGGRSLPARRETFDLVLSDMALPKSVPLHQDF
jgi:hypothetical protein